MSYTTIHQAANDMELQNRVEAAALKEAYNNPTFGDTPYGQDLKLGNITSWSTFRYPIAIGTEAEYEYAINADNPSPGGDPTVITDAEILGIVQLYWPGAPEAGPATT